MLNKEKYAKEILDIVCKTSEMPAIVKNKPISCDDAHCDECKFYNEYNESSCNASFIKWANSEYKEPEIDWTKVPVDTPVYVKDRNDNSWRKRYFCKFDIDNGLYYCYSDGGTSWSSDKDTCQWMQCKVAEGVDYSEWYKD